MAETEKRNSAADSKKKSSSLAADDFGKDFLSFWEPSNKGKDKIDFDVEEAPLNKKKSFNFDKFDDFELGGDFDKLSSFKMDMPDLDFSKSAGKTEKATAKPTGKQESDKEKFSFDFDFNELDKFELDPSPVTGKKNPTKTADGNASDNSLEHVQNQDSKNNSSSSPDAFKNQENSKSLNTDNIATVAPDNLIEPCITKGPKPSISPDLGHHDISNNLSTSTDNQITAAAEINSETHSHDRQTYQSKGSLFTGTNGEQTTQDFILQSAPGDCSAQEDLPRVKVGPSSFNPLRDDSARVEDNMIATESSQSRKSSPANSCDSKCSLGASMSKQSNAGGDFEKHCHWNKDKDSREKEVLIESIQGQIDTQNAQFTALPQKVPHRVKNIEDKRTSESKLVPALIPRGSSSCNPMSLNQKVTASLQLKVLSKSAGNVSRITSPVRMRHDSINKDRSESFITCQNNGNSITKLNSKMLNHATPREAKSVRFSSDLDFPLQTALKGNSAVIEKHRYLNSLLKRKTFEEPAAVRESTKPLIHSTETAIGRHFFDDSSETEKLVEMRYSTVTEVSDLVEQDGNIEKAKAGRKEPEETYSNKQITVEVNNISRRLSTKGSQDLSEETLLTNQHAEKADQDYAMQSASANCLAQENPAQVQILYTSLDAVQSASSREDDDCMAIDSSHSRSGSPVQSLNSKRSQEANVTQLLDDGGRFQKLVQGTTDEITKVDDKMKNSGDMQSLGTDHIKSSLQSNRKVGKPMTMKEKVIAVLQLKPLSKSAEIVPQKSLSAIQKGDSSLHNCKLKSVNLTPDTKNREAKQNHERADVLQPYVMSVASRNKRNIPSDISSFQLKATCLQEQINGSNTPRNIISNLVSSNAFTGSSKILPVQINGSSHIDVKTLGSRLMIPSLTKLHRTQNSAAARERNSLGFFDGISESPLRKSSKMPDSVMKEQNASLTSSLKRKAIEDLIDDPETSNPSKRVTEPSIGRNLYPVSPSGRKIVPVTENVEVCHADECCEDPASNCFSQRETLGDTEPLSPLDEDENVEKAKVWSKELDAIRDMLRRQNDEARDLQDRAKANNKKLQTLKQYPFEEKIRSLQMFAANLQ